MPEIVTVGGMALDGVLLSVLLTGIAGLTGLSVWLRFHKQASEGSWMDLIINAFIITGLCWKLGFLTREPSLLWERPLSLLIVRGSGWDVIAGAAISIIYLAAALRRRAISPKLLFEAAPFALLPSMFIWNALVHFPYRIPYALASGIFYVYLLRRSGSVTGSGTLRYYLLGTGFGGLAISLFIPWPEGDTIGLVSGLTPLQWFFAGHAVCGAFLNVKEEEAASVSS